LEVVEVEHFLMMVALVVVVECFPLMVEEEVVAECYQTNRQMMLFLRKYLHIVLLNG
jgi:hypothetical protein